MTCIVGFTNGKDVYIGGDSAGVGGYDLTVRADEKVFTLGEFVFGFTTSFRMGQLLRYKFTPPEFKEKQDIFAYMVTSFVEALRTVMKEGGFATKDKESEHGGTFLVGIRGKLFSIQGDYQVAESADRYCAVGCGDNIAIGAMYALEKSGVPVSAEAAITIALGAAERFSAGVRGPFVIRRVS